MNSAVHNKIVSFIWSIADDCLRDVYTRGKYRDVILPMVVLRRIDALLEHSKEAVAEELKFQKEELELTEWDPAGLCDVTGYPFYNTSEWTLQRLYGTATDSAQILESNFMDYLNGFSDNIQEIIRKFKLRMQISHMISKDVMLDVLEKFTSPYINLTIEDRLDPEGRNMPALTNLGMGYVFEELIRRFNEENNEEAGEHFTPREVIKLMTHLVIEPVKDNLPPVITIYDPACGTGGMLTESQNFIRDPEGPIQSDSAVHLYGKEINDETYAICKSDMMIKGDDPENIRSGSTLSTNEFAGTTFNFMLSNPPYGKSWSSEVRYIKDGSSVIDDRFIVELTDYFGNINEEDATPRTSDGQLLFLMEMVDKMKPDDGKTSGSRIATVHNGSSLFTGDAGGGESNIRRYLIENDLVETIIQLPNNLFYNTGITTYIWLLSNAKTADRKGKLQLIDANALYKKLRKNLGDKNCELTDEHIAEILQTYLMMDEIENTLDEAGEPVGIASKVFNNKDFGYYKVTIERPARYRSQFTEEAIDSLKYQRGLEEVMQQGYLQYGDTILDDNFPDKIMELMEWCEKEGIELTTANKRKLRNKKSWEQTSLLYLNARTLMELVGNDAFMNFNNFEETVKSIIKEQKLSITASELRKILQSVSNYDEDADKVIKKKVKLKGYKLQDLLSHLSCTEEDLPYYGYFPTEKEHEYVQYETESDLRDTENIPLTARIQDYFLREVKPYIEESWIDLDKTKIGYEISFNKHFYKHKPLRKLSEVNTEILELSRESEGLLEEILGI